MIKEFSNRLQSDNKVRVVTLQNLEAMCDRLSGVYHRFWVEKAGEHRVMVGYSNPDEYAAESPMFCVFPAYVDSSFYEHTLYVVLGTILDISYDTWNGEGWQAFTPLQDCPELFRSNPDSDDWKSREEIEKK